VNNKHGDEFIVNGGNNDETMGKWWQERWNDNTWWENIRKTMRNDENGDGGWWQSVQWHVGDKVLFWVTRELKRMPKDDSGTITNSIEKYVKRWQHYP
jgi:hypothetical protein